MPVDPSGHARDFPALIRQYVHEELDALNTADLGVIETIDRDTMRVDIALKHDRGVIVDDVPIATPFARNGVGDIPPLRAGDEGVVVFLDLPLDGGMAEARGYVDMDAHRTHRVNDAVFFPAMVFYGNDDVPDHDADANERVIAHPDGSRVRMHGARLELSHGDSDPGQHTGQDRARIRLTDDPYYDEREGEAGDTADPEVVYDRKQLWPRPGAAAVQLDHPSRAGVTITDLGIGALEGETDLGTRQRGLHLGAVNDPERVRVRGHRHEVALPDQPVTDQDVRVDGDGTGTVTIPHSLGVAPGFADVTPLNPASRGVFYVADKTPTTVTIEYETVREVGTDNLHYDVFTHPPADGSGEALVTTAPLTAREQTARLATPGARADVANADAPGVQTAVTRAENLVAFMQYYADGAVDPAVPGAWPDVEFVPSTEEWAAFSDSAYDPATFEEPTTDTAERGAVDIEDDILPYDGGEAPE